MLIFVLVEYLDQNRHKTDEIKWYLQPNQFIEFRVCTQPYTLTTDHIAQTLDFRQR